MPTTAILTQDPIFKTSFSNEAIKDTVNWKENFDAHSIVVENEMDKWVKENAKHLDLNKLKNKMLCAVEWSMLTQDFRFDFNELINQWIKNNRLDKNSCDEFLKKKGFDFTKGLSKNNFSFLESFPSEHGNSFFIKKKSYFLTSPNAVSCLLNRLEKKYQFDIMLEYISEYLEDLRFDSERLGDELYEALSDEPRNFDKYEPKCLENDPSDLELHSAEQRYFEENKEIENAILFAKRLIQEDESFENNCLSFIVEQYKKKFDEVKSHSLTKKLRLEFIKEWDKNFLDFLKSSIWSALKKSGILYHGALGPDNHENNIYDSMFAQIHAGLYQFCAKIIDKTPCYYLGH